MVLGMAAVGAAAAVQMLVVLPLARRLRRNGTERPGG